MGKASRQKGAKREKKVDFGQPGRRFLDKAGLCRIPPSPRLWAFLEGTLPRPYVERLDKAMTARERGDHSFDPYVLLWENFATTKATYGWLAPISEPWLAWTEEFGSFGPRILDVGCGMGVHTCYYAWRHPEGEVVGVDRSTVGIERAEELAAEIGLSNVRFVTASVEELALADLGGPFDTVTASTFLVDAEPDLLALPHPDPWSVVRSAERCMADHRGQNLDRLASFLKPGGEYLGLERAPDAVALASWLGAVNASGLQTRQTTPLPIQIPGSPERIPAVQAVKADPLAGGPLMDLVRAAMPQDFAEEDALATDPPVDRLWGREFHVQDAGGSGITRIEVFRLTSGLIAHYQRTSRGYRELWCTEDPEEAIGEAEHFLSMAERSPKVVNIVALDPEGGWR